MNSTEQRFDELPDYKAVEKAKKLGQKIFKIGQVVEIEDERFEITMISRKRLTLKPEGW